VPLSGFDLDEATASAMTFAALRTVHVASLLPCVDTVATQSMRRSSSLSSVRRHVTAVDGAVNGRRTLFYTLPTHQIPLGRQFRIRMQNILH